MTTSYQEKRKGSLFNGKEITEMDESQAFHELHPGAVYLHDGEQYEVLKLDLVSRTALAVPFMEIIIQFHPAQRIQEFCRPSKKKLLKE